MNKNKASATRRKNAELRRERSVREHLDKELISNAARAVLTDEAATASEKWQAALLLSNAAGYGLVKAPESADVEKINAELKKIFASIEK